MAEHAREAQAPLRHDAVPVVVAAVEVGIGGDRLARDLVERDVLGREPRRGGDHERVPDAVGVGQRPLQRLHRAEASAHHRRPARDAEPVGEPRLRLDPVLDGHHREARPVGFAGAGVGRRRAGRAEAAAEVVHADDEEPVGVERLAGADHVVPPADVPGVVGVVPGDVMRGVQRVADQHRIRARRVQAPVGLEDEVVGVERGAAFHAERLREAQPPRRRGADRAGEIRVVWTHKAKARSACVCRTGLEPLALAEFQPGPVAGPAPAS